MMKTKNPFLLALLINFLWINASEVFRYFVFIMPMMREAFPEIANIAPMNFTIFMIWGVWDTILIVFTTFFHWLYLNRFGLSYKNALFSGTFVWAGIFIILWLGLYNMNLATPTIVFTALSLSFFEMVIGAFIVNWCLIKKP